MAARTAGRKRETMEALQQYTGNLGKTVVSFLPDSPFTGVLDRFAGVSQLALEYLNWFYPVGDFLKIASAWLTAIGVYYAYSAIMRWTKIIGG